MSSVNQTYGANIAFIEELREKFIADPESVSASWREFFTDYQPPADDADEDPPATTAAAQASPPAAPQSTAAPATSVPAAAPAAPRPAPVAAAPAPGTTAVALRGAASKIVTNMEASLTVPTATSIRSIPVKALEENRRVINNHLVLHGQSKASYTHIIAWAIVKALEAQGMHVRHIRRIVEAVRSSVHPRPLASLSWGVAGQEIFVGYPDGSWVGDRRPNQNVLIDTIDLEEIRGDARRSAQERRPEHVGSVESRRGALGSKEVFAGTRIPVNAVVEYLQRGASDQRILEGFPDLRAEDINFARQRVG